MTTIAPVPFLRRSGVLIFFAIAIALLWSAPLWLTAGKTGVYDWGFMENVWEVRWKTLREYGQWPSHNPWQGGGLPDCLIPGFLSLQAVMTFLFGAKAGISGFLIGYLVLGVFGFYKLGLKLFDGDQSAALLLSIIGPASPALAIHLAVGHLIFINVLAWPALFYLFLSSDRPRANGIKAGLLFAVVFNDTPFYTTVYGALILGVAFIFRVISGPSSVRRQLTSFALHAAIVALPFMLPVILPLLSIAADYQRVANTPASFPLRTLVAAYFQPVTELKSFFYVDSLKSAWGTWEMCAYLGFGAVVFWMGGLIRDRIRWFHTAFFTVFIFTIGNEHWWQPMRWLMIVPPLSSQQSFNRLRLFVQIFFSIGAAWGLHQFLTRSILSGWKKKLVLACAAVAAGEIMVVAHLVARRSHIDYESPGFINAHEGAFYQQSHRLPGLPPVFDGWPADLAQHTRANIGIVAEAAAIPSQFRKPSSVKTTDQSAYRGEFVQAGVPVSPNYWSPNRLTFSGLNPVAPLEINLNRGHPWRNFGRPLFPADRIVEFDKPFLVQPDAAGRVELSYVWDMQRESWIWALGALGVTAAFCFYSRRREINSVRKCAAPL